MSHTADHTRPLTLTERAIFVVLLRHRGEFVALPVLALEAYGLTQATAGIRVETLFRAHISNLRAKLRLRPRPVEITTLRGVGYGIDAPTFAGGTAVCECGTRYEMLTGDCQHERWMACPDHRGERYDRARAELEAWRRRNRRRARRAS